jgi:hypothetical protein
VKGVFWNKQREKWRAHIYLNKKTIYLGLYDDLEDAKNARQQFANELFGDFIHVCEKL